MKVTIKHYYDFQPNKVNIGPALDTAQGWDSLRVDQPDADDFFAIPADREQWRQKARRNPLWVREARDILAFADGKFRRICSCGVGAGYLEFLIKDADPSMEMVCSDYTPRAIERLGTVFPEAERLYCFDMLNGDWPRDEQNSLHLLYRVDTIFDDVQWRHVAGRMHAAGVEHVLFVPCEFLGWQRFAAQSIKYFRSRLLNRPVTFAGYLRTASALERLFSGFYSVRRKVPVGGMAGYYLIRNS